MGEAIEEAVCFYKLIVRNTEEDKFVKMGVVK